MSALVLRALVDSSIRMSIVAAVVGLILVAFRIRAGHARHAVWTAVLCGMLSMLFLPYCLPVIELWVPAMSQRIDRIRPEEAVPPASTASALTATLTPAGAVTAALRPASEASPERSLPRSTMWPAVVLTTYIVGTMLFFLRLALGWRAANRIARSSHPIGPALAFPRFRESPLVVTPVTLGVAAPTIILPMTWRRWPEDKLRAVLFHESAHVQRWDPLVNILTQVNRCLFWFHPLAWWLSRELAATAEHACDEAAVRSIGDPRRYAEVLFEIAGAVTKHGGRVASLGAGIGGSGVLGDRIDRVLREGPRDRVSSIRTRAAVASCSLAIVLTAACNPPSTPQALQERPGRDAEARLREFDVRFHRADREMTSEQAADLEASLGQNADDLATRERLLYYYWARLSPQAAARDEKAIAARRGHILWLIEHHPESGLAGAAEVRMFPAGFDSLGDAPGYDRARRMWLTHVSRPTATPAVLRNAANFFEAADKPLAEEMLQRVQAQSADGGGSKLLGAFYAAVLAGRYVPTAAQMARRDVAAADPKSAYAEGVRIKLAGSTDDVLLVAAASYLLASPRQTPEGGAVQDRLAAQYLERALQRSPQAPQARTALAMARTRERRLRAREVFDGIPRQAQDAAFAALPEDQRFAMLLEGAGDGGALLGFGNAVEWQKDQNLSEYFTLGRQRLRKDAEDLLTLASRFRTDSNYGTAIYRANMTLGALALVDGDRTTAVRRLRQASEAPTSEQLAYMPREVLTDLPAELLKRGERDSVIQYFERMAQTSVVQREALHGWAVAIQHGEMPNFDSVY